MSYRLDYYAQLAATVARNPQARPTRPIPANPTRALTNTVFTLAGAGIRHRYAEASRRQQFLRLAIVTLGPDLPRLIPTSPSSISRDDAGRWRGYFAERGKLDTCRRCHRVASGKSRLLT